MEDLRASLRESARRLFDSEVGLPVIPANAGIQCLINGTKTLDPSVRRDDGLLRRCLAFGERLARPMDKGAFLMKNRALRVIASAFLLALASIAPAVPAAAPTNHAATSDRQAFVNDLERRTFDWFWDSADPVTGLVPDHYPGESFSSIAAVGFALTAYGVGAERGYVARAQAAQRTLADRIYRRVDWPWMQVRAPLISMGWTPGGKFIPSDWKGYDEGMLVYILALGSPTHPVKPDAWKAWLSTNDKTWGTFYGQTFLNFAPMFGHQYSHVWVDFRGIRDDWNRKHGLDYFENSRRATYSQRNYAIANPGKWTGYGANVWGLTASNGPGGIVVEQDDRTLKFDGYTARGAGLDYISDDGTIAPTAAAGSIAFAPEIVLPALATMKLRYGKWIYNRYGFVDAFNLSFHTRTELRTGRLVPELGWVDTVQLGIDQGPIVLMIENWRSNFVWKVMRRNPYIRKGLQRAGFTGGWLDASLRTGPSTTPARHAAAHGSLRARGSVPATAATHHVRRTPPPQPRTAHPG
jgi:hypothetical protein